MPITYRCVNSAGQDVDIHDLIEARADELSELGPQEVARRLAEPPALTPALRITFTRDVPTSATTGGSTVHIVAQDSGGRP